MTLSKSTETNGEMTAGMPETVFITDHQREYLSYLETPIVQIDRLRQTRIL